MHKDNRVLPHSPATLGVSEKHLTITDAAPQLGTPEIEAYACHRCGAIDTPTLGPGRGPHYANARCRHCGNFIRWLSLYTPAEREARRQQARLQAMAQKPPSRLQLAYLQALGDAPGSPPRNMAEASERIDNLKRGRVA